MSRKSCETSTTPPSNSLMASARASMVSKSKWFVCRCQSKQRSAIRSFRKISAMPIAHRLIKQQHVRSCQRQPGKDDTSTLTVTELFHGNNLAATREAKAAQNGSHVLILVYSRPIFVTESVDKEADRCSTEIQLVRKMLMEPRNPKMVVTFDLSRSCLHCQTQQCQWSEGYKGRIS